MADLPPNFEVPSPRRGRPLRPTIVSFAGWVLVIAGALTTIGGFLFLAAGSSEGTSLGLGLAAFGVAELASGIEVLRMVAAFRTIGVVVASVGAVIDVVGLISGSRWQVVALVLHVAALIVLSSQREAFVGPG
jgi:hypothetical protein